MMYRFTLCLHRFVLLLLCLACLSAVAAAAGEYRVLIDADDDPTTGCSVTIAGSTFDGVEQILVTTVDNGTDEVTAVERQACDAGSGTFDPPVVVSAPFSTPWPVGPGLGTMGSDVVETYVPVADLGTDLISIRLGYASDDGLTPTSNQDVMFTTTGGGGGDPIVLGLGAALLEIPTVSPLGLVLLSLLLAGAAAWVLRDAERLAGGGTVAAVLLMLALAPVALAVADVVLDGDPSDWVGGIDAQGTDPAADVPGSADILAGYAAVSTDGTILYLRFDVTREAQPTAVDDTFTVDEDDPQTILDVLLNDTDLDGGLIEVIAVTQPAGGTVAITNGGSDVGYTPDPDFCNDGTPTDDFTYTLNGGSTATVAVTVTCVNDAPVKTGGGSGPAVFVEGGGPVVLDPDVTVEDVDDVNLESATVTITNLLDGTDEVLAADVTGTVITAAYSSATGILSLTGTDTVANYQQVLRTVTYDNTSADPDTMDRGLTCVANDGDSDSNVLNMSVTVGAVNTPPTKTAGGGGPASFVEDGGPVAIDPGVTISDPDDVNMESATITLTNPLDGADEVLAASTGGTGITAVYNSGTGVLSLTGSDTIANYQAVLQSITYDNASDDPDLTDRSIDCLVNDGSDDSNTLTATVEITATNDAPTITAITDQTIDEDTSTGALAFTIDDPDTAVGSLVVTSSSSDQTLIPDANLTIGGTAPNLTIEATPAVDENGGPVTITVSVDDGVAPPTSTTFDVTVNPVDDPPTITAIADQTIDEDTSTGPLGFTIGDPDTAVGSLVVTAMSSDQTLIPDANLAIAGTAPNLTLEATPAADQNGGPATITVSVDDGANPPVSETFSVTVNPVNDPPVATSPISYAAIGNTLLRVPGTDGEHDGGVPGRIASSADASDAFVKAGPSDIDSPAANLVFTPKNAELTDQGGLITLDDDGDFHYTPPIGFTGVDMETLQIVDGDGGSVAVTLQITVADMIWYVEDTTGAKNPAGNTDGRSTDAFETLAAAESASGANHIILVMETTSALTDGITLKSGQKLYGQRVEEETTSLMPAGFIWEEIDDTNARPQIHPANGAAVTVDTTAGALTGVEIRHLDLESGDDDAIAVTTAGSNIATVLIDENVIGAAGVEGVDVNGGHTTGTATVTLTDNTITSTVDGVNVSVTAGGDLALAIDRLVDVTAGGDGIELRSPGAGTLTVTSFTANSIHQDTAGNGFVADDVTFDDGGGSVSATTFTVGTTGDGVGLGGMLLATVRGGLTFTDLDVQASSGTGVLVDNSTLAVGDFTLTTGAGSTVAAAGGPALDLDPMTAAVTLDNLTSTGSPTQGVRLVDVAGTVNVVAGSISGSTGNAFEVAGGTAVVDYDGTIANTSARSVSVTGRPGGAGNVTFGGDVGTSITQNSGTGVLVDSNAGGTVAFDGGVFLSTGTSPAVTLTSNGGAVVNFNGGVDLDTSSGNGFVATGGGTVNVLSGAVSTTADTTTGTLVRIINTTIGGSGVYFDSTSKTGGADGILLTQVGAGDFTTNGGSILDQTDRAFDVSGGSGDVTVAANLSTTATGRTVEVTTHSGGTVDFNGFIDDDGLGIRLANNVGAILRFDGGMDVDTAAGSGTEEGFEATGGGTLHVTGTNDVDTSLATGVAVNIAGGTTIGSDGVTFRNVSANGAASGIVLDTTGTTGSFLVSGDGSTTGGVLDRDGSGGTITATIGGSLANANNVTLRQVDFTNNGDHAVASSGGSNHVLSAVTIQNPTNHGWEAIELTGTNRIDHGSLVTAFDGTNQDGVRLVNTNTSFTSFTVDNVTFSNSATGNDGFFHRALGTTAGSVIITGSTFTGLDADGVQVANDGSGTVTTTVQGNSFTTADSTDGDGNNGLALNLAGTGVHNFTVGGPNAGEPNTFTDVNRLGDNTGVINVTAAGAGTGATSRLVGSIIGNSISNSSGRRGISVLMEASGGTGHGGHTIVIDDNDVNDVAREGIYVGMSSVGGRSNTGNKITIANNNVGDVSVVATEGDTREGIEIETFQDSTGGSSIEADILVEDNVAVINNTDETFRVTNEAFYAGDSTTLDVTVHGNTFTNNDGSGDTFELRNWDAGSTSCLDINAANQAADRNNANRGYLLARSGGTVNVEGMGAGPHTDAQVNAFVDARNDGGASAASGNGFTGNVTCDVP